METKQSDPRLFICVMPGGIVYCDRTREVAGDYKRLAFLPYQTLELELKPRCDASLKAEIIEHAASIQARKGESFRVSACGHTVKLGK